jgi:hypothetical protein
VFFGGPNEEALFLEQVLPAMPGGQHLREIPLDDDRRNLPPFPVDVNDLDETLIIQQAASSPGAGNPRQAFENEAFSAVQGPAGTYLWTGDASDLAAAGFPNNNAMQQTIINPAASNITVAIPIAGVENIVSFFTPAGVPGLLNWMPGGDAVWSATIQIVTATPAGALDFLGFTVQRVTAAGAAVAGAQSLFLGTGVPSPLVSGTIVTGTGNALAGPGFGTMNPAARAATDRLRMQVVVSHSGAPAIVGSFVMTVGDGTGRTVTTIPS